jgi:hypothetical protein
MAPGQLLMFCEGEPAIAEQGHGVTFGNFAGLGAD